MFAHPTWLCWLLNVMDKSRSNMILTHLFKYLKCHRITQLSFSLFVIILCSCQQTKDNPSWQRQKTNESITPSAAMPSERKINERIPSLAAISPESSEWKTLVQRGDRVTKNKDWKKAARFYNDALDVINDPRKTPQIPSPAQIEKIHHLASNAMLLAVHTGQSRSAQSCSTMMRSQVRGFKIKKHLIPIQFDYRTSNFSASGKQAARQLAHCFQQNDVREIHLMGHTDKRGTDDFNMTLSIERAKALKKYLESEGTSAPIVTSGQGEREPLQLNNPANYTQEEIYALNRRVEVMTQ